ncbi:hypothetical protein KY314_00475 [Candidatus Woesearchaeota archaeon]|nr:hypothetical protein [Candidatus Woesearchaeota archaeon]
MEVCMRNVKESSWKHFKTAAAKRGMPLGEFFNELSYEIDRISKNPWDKILNRKRIFTDKELKEMEKAMKEFRRDFKFR